MGTNHDNRTNDEIKATKSPRLAKVDKMTTPPKYLAEFTVEATEMPMFDINPNAKRRWYPFPLDMLRRESCYPATAVVIDGMRSDMAAREVHPGEPVPRVTLHTWVNFAGWGPNAERWESFGWRVLERNTRGDLDFDPVREANRFTGPEVAASANAVEDTNAMTARNAPEPVIARYKGKPRTCAAIDDNIECFEPAGAHDWPQQYPGLCISHAIKAAGHHGLKPGETLTGRGWQKKLRDKVALAESMTPRPVELPVQSSNVARVQYLLNATMPVGILRVQFKQGEKLLGAYEYKDVPKSTWEAMEATVAHGKSIGAFIQTQVRGKFPTIPVPAMWDMPLKPAVCCVRNCPVTKPLHLCHGPAGGDPCDRLFCIEHGHIHRDATLGHHMEEFNR